MIECVWREASTPGENGVRLVRCFRCQNRLETAEPLESLHANCRPTHPQPPVGPGTHLKRLFAAVNIASSGDCGCDTFAAQMNAWGVEGCRAHFEEIVEYLRTKAKERGLIFFEIGARFLVNRAIKLAKRDEIRRAKAARRA